MAGQYYLMPSGKFPVQGGKPILLTAEDFEECCCGGACCVDSECCGFVVGDRWTVTVIEDKIYYDIPQPRVSGWEIWECVAFTPDPVFVRIAQGGDIAAPIQGFSCEDEEWSWAPTEDPFTCTDPLWARSTHRYYLSGRDSWKKCGGYSYVFRDEELFYNHYPSPDPGCYGTVIIYRRIDTSYSVVRSTFGTGAEDRTCERLDEAACASVGGEFKPDVTCTPDPCNEEGACCPQDSNLCYVTTAKDCEATGGTFMGEGEPCTPNPCDYRWCHTRQWIGRPGGYAGTDPVRCGVGSPDLCTLILTEYLGETRQCAQVGSITDPCDPLSVLDTVACCGWSGGVVSDQNYGAACKP